jgi:sugar/nucleoside kinase (ribokinase family)
MVSGGVLVCGNAVMDILVRRVDRMEWGTSTWVESIEQHMGGNGASTAYSLAKHGAPVRLWSAVGPDAFGDLMLERLRSAGVDVSRVIRGEVPSSVSVVLVNSAGERILLHRPGVSSETLSAPLEFDVELTAGISHFHLANLFSLPLLRGCGTQIMRSARDQGLTTSIDTGWDSRGRWIEDLGSCLPYTDVLFVNESEAKMLAGTADAGGRLREYGAGIVVLKLGAQGSIVFTADRHEHVPAFEVDAVDTTGAGDCFAGAFLAALHQGLDLYAAARFANAAAGLAIGCLGATDGLRSWDETRAWMKTAPVR